MPMPWFSKRRPSQKGRDARSGHVANMRSRCYVVGPGVACKLAHVSYDIPLLAKHDIDFKPGPGVIDQAMITFEL